VPVLPAHRVATPVLERLANAGEAPGGVLGAGAPAGEASGGVLGAGATAEEAEGQDAGAGATAGEACGEVLGAGATAAWVDLGGFVVVLTTREVPLLPNGVALTAGAGALARVVAAGSAVRFAPGRVELGGLRVVWDPADPPAWDPAVPPPPTGPATAPSPGGGSEAVGRRGAALLAAIGVSPHPDPAALVEGLAGVGLATAADPDGAAGLEVLLRAVRERNPAAAAEAAGRLLGRGPGLTPEGDDLLAAVAGTLAVLGPAAGIDQPSQTALLAALAPAPSAKSPQPSRTPTAPARPGPAPRSRFPLVPAPPGRTTALAATLLQLACRGLLAEPAGRLLDLGPAGEAAWPAALRRLERLGHGSGRAYAAGIAATALLLTADHAMGRSPSTPARGRPGGR